MVLVIFQDFVHSISPFPFPTRWISRMTLAQTLTTLQCAPVCTLCPHSGVRQISRCACADLELWKVYAKSYFTTCLPITWRHRNPIFRSKQAGLQVHEFPFSVFFTGCRICQESLTGLKLHHVFTRHIEALEPNFQGQTS